MNLDLLSGGAAQALVKALAPGFERDTGCRIAGTFGAVGAMREKLLAGAPADLVILSADIVDALKREGHVAIDSAVPIGAVRTSVAVRVGTEPPAIGDAAALAAALGGADAVYFPDPERATAGIHFQKVLERLGLAERLSARLRPHPNGAAAMAALAAAPEARPIGCTQATEILATPGITLVAPLPSEFELVTIYTAAVTSRTAAPELARRFAALLAEPAQQPLRERLGFEPIAAVAP